VGVDTERVARQSTNAEAPTESAGGTI